MNSVRQMLAGKKTYLLIASAVLTALIGWSEGTISDSELLVAVILSLTQATQRAAIGGARKIAPCLLLCLFLPGCGGNARMDLAASDALVATAHQLDIALEEYHGDIEAGDTKREAAVTSAFISRVVRDRNAADADLEKHGEQFIAALTAIRADRDIEMRRYNNTRENIRVLRDISKGLNRVAVDSLGLQDEMRRYLSGWIDSYQRSREQSEAEKQQRRESRDQQRNALIGQATNALRDALNQQGAAQ